MSFASTIPESNPELVVGTEADFETVNFGAGAATGTLWLDEPKLVGTPAGGVPTALAVLSSVAKDGVAWNSINDPARTTVAMLRIRRAGPVAIGI